MLSTWWNLVGSYQLCIFKIWFRFVITGIIGCYVWINDIRFYFDFVIYFILILEQTLFCIFVFYIETEKYRNSVLILDIIYLWNIYLYMKYIFMYNMYYICWCSVTHLCLTLCDPMDYSNPWPDNNIPRFDKVSGVWLRGFCNK